MTGNRSRSEDGKEGIEASSDDQLGEPQPKATSIDNFDEWWDQLMDELFSENYVPPQGLSEIAPGSPLDEAARGLMELFGSKSDKSET